MMTRNLSSALLFTAALAAAPAVEAAGPARLGELLALLDVIPTRAQWVEAGAGPHGEGLVAAALDRGLARYPRMRAASALAAFDGPATRRALGALVDAAEDDREVRIQALAALTQLERGAALPRLEGLLLDRDPELRAAAVRGLARVGGPRALAALERRRASGQELVPWVRAGIEAALRERARAP